MATLYLSMHGNDDRGVMTIDFCNGLRWLNENVYSNKRLRFVLIFSKTTIWMCMTIQYLAVNFGGLKCIRRYVFQEESHGLRFFQE